MAKTLKLTHEDDAFFDKAILALSSTADLPDDATYEEKFQEAEAELRAFIRQAVKNYELSQIKSAQVTAYREASAQLDAALNQQASKLTITIE